MKRRHDWAARLHNFIDEVKRKPFSWAEDCLTGFAAGVVMAQTDVDIVAEYRGRYDDSLGAARELERAGFDNLADALASRLPRYEHPSQAQIGDIAAIVTDDPFGFSLGVFNGETILACGETGMVVLSRTAAVQAFRVG